MQPLSQDNKLIIDRLSDMGLSNALIRDFSNILPFIVPDQWFTSISLRKQMSKDFSFTRKELSKLSTALSNLYMNTNLLERKEKRRLYFHFNMQHHTSHWAYRITSQAIINIMPNPELDEILQARAHTLFLMSID